MHIAGGRSQEGTANSESEERPRRFKPWVKKIPLLKFLWFISLLRDGCLIFL